MRLIEAAHANQTIVKPGDICIDATAGNGYDTLFLAKQILRMDESMHLIFRTQPSCNIS